MTLLNVATNNPFPVDKHAQVNFLLPLVFFKSFLERLDALPKLNLSNISFVMVTTCAGTKFFAGMTPIASIGPDVCACCVFPMVLFVVVCGCCCKITFFFQSFCLFFFCRSSCK